MTGRRLAICVLLSPSAGRFTMVAPERGGERVRGAVAGAAGDLGEVQGAGAKLVARQGHSPLSEVLHRCLAESLLECSGEGRPGETAEGGEFSHGPRMGGVSVDGAECWAEARVCRGLVPPWGLGALAERSTYGVDQDNVEEPVEDGLLAGGRGG